MTETITIYASEIKQLPEGVPEYHESIVYTDANGNMKQLEAGPLWDPELDQWVIKSNVSDFEPDRQYANNHFDVASGTDLSLTLELWGIMGTQYLGSGPIK